MMYADSSLKKLSSRITSYNVCYTKLLRAGLDSFFKELSADIIKRKLTQPNSQPHSQEILQAVSQRSPALLKYHSVAAHKAEPFGALLLKRRQAAAA